MRAEFSFCVLTYIHFAAISPVCRRCQSYLLIMPGRARSGGGRRWCTPGGAEGGSYLICMGTDSSPLASSCVIKFTNVERIPSGVGPEM